MITDNDIRSEIVKYLDVTHPNIVNAQALFALCKHIATLAVQQTQGDDNTCTQKR